MTKRVETFPLNFDAPMWSIEEAVPWIFFGDMREHPSWSELTTLAVGYAAGEVDDRRLSRTQSESCACLQQHLRMLGVISRGSFFTPLIWCRLAIQFWLEHGGHQKIFTTAMTRWVIEKNKGGMAFVSYKNSSHPNGREIPMEAFLFGVIEMSALLKSEWFYLCRSRKDNQNAEAESTGNRSAESQVGSNLLAAVKSAVQELSNGKQGKALFLRKPDPATGKFRFIGLREELCDAIYAISADISGKRLLKNGRYQKAYAKNSVIKAISKIAICRRSWA